MNKGFTLVELSIVLVIIGLLAGGILAGRSMITTAKVQKFVRQIQQYDIATSNFKTKYETLPGDTNLLGGVGNKDGLITDANHTATPPYYANQFSGEAAYFWRELGLDGVDNKSTIYTSTITGTFNSNAKALNAPFAAIGDQCSIKPWTDATTQEGNMYIISNYQAAVDGTNNYDSFYDYPGHANTNCVKPVDILAIDKKIDDGRMDEYPRPVMMYAHYTSTAHDRPCTINDDQCIMIIRMMLTLGQENNIRIE